MTQGEREREKGGQKIGVWPTTLRPTAVIVRYEMVHGAAVYSGRICGMRLTASTDTQLTCPAAARAPCSFRLTTGNRFFLESSPSIHQPLHPAAAVCVWFMSSSDCLRLYHWCDFRTIPAVSRLIINKHFPVKFILSVAVSVRCWYITCCWLTWANGWTVTVTVGIHYDDFLNTFLYFPLVLRYRASLETWFSAWMHVYSTYWLLVNGEKIKIFSS